MEQFEQPNYRSKSVCPREENTKTHFPMLHGMNTVKNSFMKTFFLQEKDKGDNYFLKHKKLL